MKKLSIEEKAQRYDEAFNFAEQIHMFSSNPSEIKRMEELFPELAESEDERIRKALIYHFRADGCICTNEYRIDYKDIRAWLEKQSKLTIKD